MKNEKNKKMKKIVVGALLTSTILAGGGITLFGCSNNNKQQDNPPDPVVDVEVYTQEEKAQLTSSVKTFLNVAEQEPEGDNIDIVKYKVRLAIAENAPKVFKNNKITPDQLAVVAQYLQRVKLDTGSFLDALRFDKNENDVYTGTYSIDLVKLGSVLIDYLDYIENLRYTLNHELGEDTVADVLADFVGVALGTINQNGFVSAETILDTTDRLDAATQAWREKYTFKDEDYEDEMGRGWFFNAGTYYDEEIGEDVEYNTLRNDLIKVFDALAKKYVAPLSIRDNMVYYGYDDGSQAQQGPALDTVYMWSEDHHDEYEYKYVVFVDGGVYRYSEWSSEERDADYVKENGEYYSFTNAYEEDGMTIWQYGSYDGGGLRVRFSQDSEDNEYMEIAYEMWDSYDTYQKQAAPQEAKYGTIYKYYYDGIYAYIIIDKMEDDYRVTTLQTDNGDLTIDEVRANENIEASESSLNLDSKLKEYYYNAVFNGVETKFYFENNKIVAKTEDTLATYEMDEEIPQTQVPTFNTYVGEAEEVMLDANALYAGEYGSGYIVFNYDVEQEKFVGLYRYYSSDSIPTISDVIHEGNYVEFIDSGEGWYRINEEARIVVYSDYITWEENGEVNYTKVHQSANMDSIYQYNDEDGYHYIVFTEDKDTYVYTLTSENGDLTVEQVKENGTQNGVFHTIVNGEAFYTLEKGSTIKYIVRDGNIVEQIGEYVYIKPNTEKVYRYENENYESYKYTYVVFEHCNEEDYNIFYYDSNDEYVDYYTVKDNWNNNTLYAQGNKDGILKYTDDWGTTYYYIYGDHIVREGEDVEAKTFIMLKDREFKLNQIYKYFDGENYRYAVFTNDDGYRMYEYVTTADNITDYYDVIEHGTSTDLGDEQKYDEATGEYYFEVVENEDENQKQTKKYVVRDGKVYNMLTTDVYFNEVEMPPTYYYVVFDLAENKAYLYTNVGESEEAKDAAFVKQNGQAFDYNVGTNKWLHTVEFDGNTIVNNNTNELKVAGGEIMPKNMTLTAVTTVAESEKATYFGKSTTGILADTLYCDTMKQNYLVFGYDEEAADFTDIYLIDMISMRGYTQNDMTVELVRNNYTQHYALTPVTGMPGIYVYDRGMISATNININNSTYKPVDASNDVEFDYTYKYGEEGNWHYVVFAQTEDEVYAYRLTSEEELTAEQVKQNATGVKVEKTTHNDQVVYLTGDGEKFTLTNGNIFYNDGKLTAVDYQNTYEHVNALLRLTQENTYTFSGPFRYAFGEESGNKVKEELLANGAQEFWGKEEYENPLYELFGDARGYYNNFHIEYRENNIYANGVPQEFVDDLTQGFTFDGKEYAGLKEIYDARINEFLEDVVNKVKLEAETSRMMTYTILNEAVKAFHDAYMIEGSNIREAVKGTIKGLNTTMKLLSGIDESKADISKTLIKKFTNGDIDRGFTKEDYQTLLQDYVEELEAKMVDGKVVTVEEAMYEVAENTKVVLNEFRAIIKVITRTLDSGGLRDFDTVIDNLFATIEDAPNKLLGPIEEKFNKAYNDYVETLKDLAKSPEAVEAVIKNLSLLAQDVKLACDNYEKGNVNSLADLDYVFKPTIEQEKGGAIYHILKIVEVLPTEKVKEWLDIDYLNEKTKGGFDFGENQDTVREYVDLARHLVDLLKEVAAETDENTELKDIVLMMFNSDTIVEDEKTFLEIIEDKFFDGSDEVEAEGDTYTRPNSIEDEEERAQALEKLAEKIKSSIIEKIVDNYEMILENIVLSLNYSNSLPMLSYEDNLVWRLIDMQNQESGLSDEEIFYHDIFLHGPKSIIDELQNLIKGDDEGKY